MFDELIMPLRATSVAFTPVVQSADDAFIASALQHASADLLNASLGSVASGSAVLGDLFDVDQKRNKAVRISARLRVFGEPN